MERNQIKDVSDKSGEPGGFSPLPSTDSANSEPLLSLACFCVTRKLSDSPETGGEKMSGTKYTVFTDKRFLTRMALPER